MHAAIKGNERADRLDSIGTVLQGRSIDHADTNSLRKLVQNKDFQLSESISPQWQHWD